MPLVDIGIAAAVVTFGCIVQGSVGFGIGLVVVPLLLWAGWSLPDAVPLLLGAALVQTSYGAYRSREHIRWSRTFRLAAVQAVFIPVGVLGMGALVEFGSDAIKQVVGVALLLILGSRLVFKPKDVPPSARLWGPVAAGAGGLLGGLVGMGGPPLVLFGLSQRWEKDEFRAFLWSQFLLAIPIFAAALVLTFGPSPLVPLGVGVALAPAAMLGTRIGLRISAAWPSQRLAKLATALLVVMAVSSLLAPVASQLYERFAVPANKLP